MAGQMHELLQETSKNLLVVERLLEEVKDEQKEQAREIGYIRERLAKLEEAKEWNGEDRRDVHNRLGSGDHTFILLQQRLANAETDAYRAAQTAKTALDAIDAHTSGKHGQVAVTKRRTRWIEWAKLLAPFVLPPIITVIGTAMGYAALSAKILEKAGHP